MSEYQANIITRNPAIPGGPSPLGAAPGVWRLNDVAYWVKQGVWPNASADGYWPYTSLLLSTTSLGNANNNLFVDSSGAFNPVSRNGNTTQGSFTPYSTNWSNYFDGTSDSLTYTGGTSLNFGTSDFTIELWAFLTNTGTYSPFIRPDDSGSFPEFGYDFSSGQLKFDARNAPIVAVTTTMPTNQWVHVAVSRSGTSLRLFVNGTQVGSTTTNSTNFGSTTGTIRIGGSSFSASHTVNGYLSNFRVLKGTALYTSNFTPPTTALTAISGTSLLTCQSNRFRDASSNNFTITVAGNTSVTDYNPFSPGSAIAYNQSDITNWSGYFDGSGDYLNTAASSSLGLTGDWTVEGWLYQTSTAGAQIFLDTRGSGATGFGIYCSLTGYAGGPGAFGYATNSALVAVSSTVIPLNAWTHLAVTRSGNTITGYINGVSAFTYTEGRTLSSTMSYFIGADYVGTSNAYGYMSNFRVVRGTAVYTGNFTPPTTNLTAISGTSLLTLQNAAFTDNSTNNFVITPNGNVTVTGNSPFNTVGYWSNYFDGSGDYLSLSSNAAFDCSTGNWTVEGWVNVTTRTTNYPLFFGNNRGSFTTDALALTVSNSDSASYNDKFVFAWGSAGFSSPSAGTSALLVSSVTNSINTWYHFAVVRNGTSIKMYRDGVEVASATISSGATFNWGFNGVLVGGGNWDGANGYINGYISNLRLVKGTAVYTAAFTPPTSPLTAISGTSLLTCQNGRFIDNSTNAFTVTRNGDVTIQSFDPFYTATIASNGGSMYFDGSGDYLTSPSSPNYALGTGDFIVEVWVNPSVQGGHGSSNNDCIIDFRPGSNGAYGTLYSFNSGASINWVVSGAIRITGGAIPNNAWSHLMVSRVSGSTRLFINGVQSGSTYADSTNYLQAPVWLGQFNDGTGAGWFQGYMSGARIVKGTGVSSTFTPPTAPVTPTAATTLLLNGMNAGIYDATTINDMETVGNAQVSTVQSKFGGSSMYFDGSGDSGRIAVNQPALQFGTSNFTAEGWVYSTGGTGTYQHILTGGTSWTTGSGGIYWYYNGGSPTLGAAWNQIATNPAVNSGTLSINTWYHFALVRNGNTMTLYINGTSVSSISVTGVSLAFNNQSRTNIGGGGWDNDFAGYIDDLRVTNGIARYTSNFTPPTQAFPTY